MRDWDWRTVKITNELLLSRKCPDCEQPKGAWCVYLPLKGAGQFPSPSVAARVAKTGKRTVRCHDGRYRVARNVLRRVWLNEHRPKVVPPSEVMMRSLAGIQEFERREREQLRAWLTEHAALLVFADQAPRVEPTRNILASIPGSVIEAGL